MSLTSATDGRQLHKSLTLWRQELRQREKSELAKKALAHRLKRYADFTTTDKKRKSILFYMYQDGLPSLEAVYLPPYTEAAV